MQVTAQDRKACGNDGAVEGDMKRAIETIAKTSQGAGEGLACGAPPGPGRGGRAPSPGQQMAPSARSGGALSLRARVVLRNALRSWARPARLWVWSGGRVSPRGCQRGEYQFRSGIGADCHCLNYRTEPMSL